MLDFAILAIFPGIMAFAAFSDILTMTIPNRLSLLLILGFFPLAFAIGLPLATIGWHIVAAAAVLAIGFAFFNFGWIGGGDAKLAATTALWLGFGLLPAYGVLAAIFGGVLTLAIVQLRRIEFSSERWGGAWLARLRDKTIGVPYGVALAAAGLVVYPDTAIWLAAKSF